MKKVIATYILIMELDVGWKNSKIHIKTWAYFAQVVHKWIVKQVLQVNYDSFRVQAFALIINKYFKKLNLSWRNDIYLKDAFLPATFAKYV